MKAAGRIVVVKGGAAGIGKPLCQRFHAEGADGVIVADPALAEARSVAESVGGDAIERDLAEEGQIVRLVERVERRRGPIDQFCSNAGMAKLRRQADAN